MREQSSLTATVLRDQAHGTLLPTGKWSSDDQLQPLIYSAVAIFTVAQIFLLCVGRLQLCTDRVPIYRPLQLWVSRKEITHSFLADLKAGWARLAAIIRHRKSKSTSTAATPQGTATTPSQKHPIISFIMDLLTLTVLVAVMVFGPFVIIAFIIWIETYIHSDGKPREGVEAVGQWSFIVQIGILLLAVLIIRLRYRIASEDEIRRDLERARVHVAHLESIAEKKRMDRVAKAEKKNRHRNKEGREGLSHRIGLSRLGARNENDKEKEGKDGPVPKVSSSPPEDRDHSQEPQEV